MFEIILAILVILVICFCVAFVSVKIIEKINQKAFDRFLENLDLSTLSDIPSGGEDNTFTK